LSPEQVRAGKPAAACQQLKIAGYMPNQIPYLCAEEAGRVFIDLGIVLNGQAV
jgi:hypothetical protein